MAAAVKAPITIAIDALLNDCIAPLLKSQGFKKKAQRFYRKSGDAIHLLELDRGKYNEGHKGKFGIAVGVFYPNVWQMVCDLRPGWGAEFSVEFPPIQNCLLDHGIYQRNAAALDQYWDIDATQDNVDLANTVSAVIESEGLAWLTAHTPIKMCFPRLRELSAKNEWLASVYLFCGALLEKDTALASECLTKILASKNKLGFPENERELFRALAKDRGVPI